MVLRIEAFVLASPKAFRQEDRPEADPLQASDLGADGIPEPADFAIAPFHDRDRVPGVSAGRFTDDQVREPRRSILELNPLEQRFQLLVADLTANPAEIFPIDLAGWVHHSVGKLAIGGQQQQAGRIEVEASDRDPAPLVGPRQAIEDRTAALRIAAGRDLALGLVVDQGLGRGFGRDDLETPPLEEDPVSLLDGRAKPGFLAVDLDGPGFDLLFQCST
jgi:hypothetical protein